MDFGCDRIKCINLPEREDKKKSFTKIMKENNIFFEFFPAIRDKEIPSRGCFRSHAKIISDAYKDGINRLMIFEDDACSVKKISQKDIDEIRRFLDNEDWEIFFLGSIPEIWFHNLSKKESYPNIYKGHFLAAGAYILNKNGIEKYKDLEWNNPHRVIDKDVFLHNNKAYGRLPRVYMQRLITNDIQYTHKQTIPLFVKTRAIVNKLGISYALNVNIKVWKVLLSILVIIIIIIIMKRR